MTEIIVQALLAGVALCVLGFGVAVHARIAQIKTGETAVNLSVYFLGLALAVVGAPLLAVVLIVSLT